MFRQSVAKTAPALKTGLTQSRSFYAKCTLVGRLGSEPTLKQTASGSDYYIYRLAVSKPPKRDAEGQLQRDADGNPIRETDWFSVFNFRENAKDTMTRLGAGDMVLVEAIMTNKPTGEGPNTEITLSHNSLKVLSKVHREAEAGEQA